MKKITLVAIIMFLGILTTSCQKTSSTSLETIKPVIDIEFNEIYVSIYINETYDLKKGVTGIDNLDGDITHKIEIDENGYTNQKEGVYTVCFNLEDSSNNVAETKTKTITVEEKLPIYTGIIPNEIKKPQMPNCFGGAWYHKVVSSRDYWLGIEGMITLPTVNIDRYKDLITNEIITNPKNDIEFDMKNQDNPSIYMGGNATNESDIGLSLSLVQLKDGSITKGSVAFRPFWRYITSSNYDLGGYDLPNGRYYSVSSVSTGNTKNCAANYHFSYTEYYYLPGDKVKMKVTSPAPDKLQLEIELLEKSTLETSVNLRKEQNWKDPKSFISPIFHSPGHNTGIKADYKRVNAIDQTANEGKEAINTTTSVLNAIWEESYLYREINGKIQRVPMTDERVNVMNCPNPNAFVRNVTANQKEFGGETISLKPELVFKNPVNIVYYTNKKDEILL